MNLNKVLFLLALLILAQDPALCGSSQSWIGNANPDWANPSNWDHGVVPAPDDSVIIARAANQPQISRPVTVHNLLIQSDATLKLNGQNLTVTGNIIISGGSLSINGNSAFTCNGNFSNTGTFNGGTCDNNFGGDWTNNSTYVATSGRTVLSGNGVAWNQSGVFNHGGGTVEVSGQGMAIFIGSTTFNNFACTSGGKALNFNTTGIQVFSGKLYLEGSDENLIRITSTVPSVASKISVAQSSISHVSVKDSCNIGAAVFPVCSCDLGNTNWKFQKISLQVSQGAGLLEAGITANKREAVIGEVVTYTVTLISKANSDLTAVQLFNP
ncbi:MAG: hypothetical protein PHW04_19160, partial [Candidatus Wallbacteria bacterium]|nr:hypothetical protein [Candidatus Wallbacteria bacterium]